MNNLLIKNVNIIDTFQNFHGDIYIEEGIIKEVGLEIIKEGVEVLEGNGLVLMPAFIDTHAHFREPGLTHKEDIESGSKAAVKVDILQLVLWLILVLFAVIMMF